MAIITINIRIKTSIREIQIGDNTHTQDHVITPSNLSTINTIVSIPQNPIPPDGDELELELPLLIEISLPYV